MHNVARIFQFLNEKARTGHRTAIVTVTAVTGASVRNPGAHLAVCDDGSWLGSLSGGCIENAVVAEALRAIEERRAREALFGAGSPMIDIRLPCGGSVNLLFTPIDDADWAQNIMQRFNARQPAHISFKRPSGSDFGLCHAPPLRILIVGHGATVEAMAALAEAIDAEWLVATPDKAIVSRLGRSAILVDTPQRAISGLSSDQWTAAALFFHDHDWEAPILKTLLEGESFYVGAMGSQKTHDARLNMLQTLGLAPSALARIKAPIGVIPSSRDPETLALSALTEIVAAYNALQPTKIVTD